jgi:hypothetical protein
MKRWLISVSLVALLAAQVQSDEPAAKPACGKCCPAQAAAKCCQEAAKCCQEAAAKCCPEAAKCCEAKCATACSPTTAAASEDEALYAELVGIIRETTSRDTFMTAVAGLMATEKGGRRAIPVVIRHAERLGILKGMACDGEMTPGQQLVHAYLDNCVAWQQSQWSPAHDVVTPVRFTRPAVAFEAQVLPRPVAAPMPCPVPAQAAPEPCPCPRPAAKVAPKVVPMIDD